MHSNHIQMVMALGDLYYKVCPAWALQAGWGATANEASENETLPRHVLIRKKRMASRSPFHIASRIRLGKTKVRKKDRHEVHFLTSWRRLFFNLRVLRFPQAPIPVPHVRPIYGRSDGLLLHPR